jgi:hypothetical protein
MDHDAARIRRHTATELLRRIDDDFAQHARQGDYLPMSALS